MEARVVYERCRCAMEPERRARVVGCALGTCDPYEVYLVREPSLTGLREKLRDPHPAAFLWQHCYYTITATRCRER